MLPWSSHYSPVMTQNSNDAEEGLYLTNLFLADCIISSYRGLSIVEYFLNDVSCLGSKECPELNKCKSINQ